MMSSARWAVIVAALALVGGGCAPVRPPISSDLVMVKTAQGLAAFDWANGRTVYQTSNAVPAADWSRLAVSAPDGEHGTLNLLDGRTGVRQASLTVPPGLVAAAISGDARRVALGPADGGTAWHPIGRTQTRIVVADPSGAVEPRTYDLPGNYQPDAFAYDNQHLFVLQYLPPEAPAGYRVRSLDLKTGAISGLDSRFKVAVPEETMRGTRQTSVLSADHQTLYTLYTNQPEHLHSRDLARALSQSSGEYAAFVHVLSLSGGWAYCLDLPQPFGVGPASAHALALSADGQWLYVSDRSSGKVALLDTTLLTLRATADAGADPLAGNVSAAAQIGPNGSLFLSSAAELVVVEPKSLAVQRRLPMPAAPTGLGVSLDGQRLFVSTADRLIAIDPLTGADLGGFALAGGQRIEHVGKF